MWELKQQKNYLIKWTSVSLINSILPKQRECTNKYAKLSCSEHDFVNTFKKLKYVVFITD